MGLVFKIMSLVMPVFNAVENMKGKKGKDKEDAAIALGATLLAGTEFALEKDILDDESVLEAQRNVYKAVAALDKVVKIAKAKHVAKIENKQ